MRGMSFVPSALLVGPFIRFNNYDPETYQYTASVLIVVNPALNDEPTLVYESCRREEEEAPKIQLDEFKRFTFWRFDLSLELSDEERPVKYKISCDGEEVKAKFYVPGYTQPWHWAFYSCNGFHEPAEADALDGIQPLWRDFNSQHRKRPFHVQIGGGDQIYNDPVWKISSLLEWLAIDKNERIKERPSRFMTDETNTYYFDAYCQHFSEPEFKDALASVPYVFTWDDHDIFDGYGSYPDHLQNCHVFRMVFAAAKRFYLLFQQHATEDNAVELNNMFGSEGGYNEIKRFGSSVALWAMDNRTERSINTIVASGTHEIAKEMLLELPEDVRHVIVLATVPLVYPELPAEAAFQDVQDGTGIIGMFFNKTGLSQSLLNQFGEPDLLDDIIDHWSASTHKEERIQLIKNMQEVAQTKKVRVTFISGDVHSAGIGRFYSYPKHAETLYIGGEECEDFRDDFRFMPNITSSAMGNTPMPLNLVTAYNKINSAVNVEGLLPTREKMVHRFRSKTDKVFGNRNYCTVEERPYNPDSDAIENGALNFTLRGENRKKHSVDFWHNWVPMLTTNEDLWEGQRDMPDEDDDAEY